ncbi:hypothetical protein AX17_004895 [Amanita inopinata Kibby_2008]|nr:hypothetical protein AX17_004895 [Amanita inopinata Kibby_2008]
MTAPTLSTQTLEDMIRRHIKLTCRLQKNSEFLVSADPKEFLQAYERHRKGGGGGGGVNPAQALQVLQDPEDSDDYLNKLERQCDVSTETLDDYVKSNDAIHALMAIQLRMIEGQPRDVQDDFWEGIRANSLHREQPLFPSPVCGKPIV